MTEPGQIERVAHKAEQVPVGWHVKLDLPHLYIVGGWSLEGEIKEAESIVRDINDLFGEHVEWRGRNTPKAHVVVECQDQCSLCEREWEPYWDECTQLCSHCGAEIKEMGDE